MRCRRLFLKKCMTESINKVGLLKMSKGLADHLLWFESGWSAVKRVTWREAQQTIVKKTKRQKK